MKKRAKKDNCVIRLYFKHTSASRARVHTWHRTKLEQISFQGVHIPGTIPTGSMEDKVDGERDLCLSKYVGERDDTKSCYITGYLFCVY